MVFFFDDLTLLTSTTSEELSWSSLKQASSQSIYVKMLTSSPYEIFLLLISFYMILMKLLSLEKQSV